MSSPDSGSSQSALPPGSVLLAAAALVHAVMLVSLSAGFLNPLFDDATHRAGQAADFFAVYQAGANAADGVSVYAATPARQVVPYYYPYRYHPFVALTVGLVMQTVPPFAAYGLWVIVLEIFLLVNLRVTWGLFENKAEAAKALAIWLVFTPMYLELYMGQFSFVMASLVFWTLAAWSRGRDVAGAGWWTLSLLVKSNSAVFLPALVRERRWRIAAAGMALVVLAGLPYFAAMPGSYDEFARNYAERMSVSTLLGNQGFAALIGITTVRLAGLWTGDVHELGQRVQQMDRLMEIPVLLWMVLIVGVSLIVTFRSKRRTGPELYLLWMLAYFLFYKHVWEHQYVMLLPVFVLVYQRMNSGDLPLPGAVFWTTFAVSALPTAFVFLDTGPVLFDPELNWGIGESLLFHLPKPAAVLVLFAALGTLILRTPNTRPAP